MFWLSSGHINWGVPTMLALESVQSIEKPKSIIFISQFWLISTLQGLRSLCAIWWACKHFKASAICVTIFFKTCYGIGLHFLLYFSRVKWLKCSMIMQWLSFVSKDSIKSMMSSWFTFFRNWISFWMASAFYWVLMFLFSYIFIT